MRMSIPRTWPGLGRATAGVRFHNLPLFPPTDLPADHFDLVLGLSVMTHLTRHAQEVWLEEIRRVLRPGGIAILTFHGSSAVACGSRHLDGRQVAAFHKGFDDTLASDRFDRLIGRGYYRNTFQTAADVRLSWGRHFDVLELLEAAVSYQDVAVLRKR